MLNIYVIHFSRCRVRVAILVLSLYLQHSLKTISYRYLIL